MRFCRLKALVVRHVENWNQLAPIFRSVVFRLLQQPSLIYVELDSFPFAVLTQAVSDHLKHLYGRRACREREQYGDIPTVTKPVAPIYLELDEQSVSWTFLRGCADTLDGSTSSCVL